MNDPRRWPGWVYREGEDPDPRFSMANERTFLAWIRTALALLAAGVAVDVVQLDLPSWVQRALSILLLLLGIVCSGAAWSRRARTEWAVRRERHLPPPNSAVVIAGGIVLAGLLLVFGLLR